MHKITAIVESPKGSNQKFDYEPDTGRFKLSKVLPAGLSFPFDFGFIPDTVGEDGDPLDVMIISEAGTFPGCAIDCMLIGCIVAEQTERDGTTVRNDRYLAVSRASHQFREVSSLKDIPKVILSEIEEFFKNYNDQAGKKFKVLKRTGPKKAKKLIKQQ